MANENIPLMNLPKETGKYKVVQFDNDQPYLRFGLGPEDEDLHEYILERFAQEIDVECRIIPGPVDLISMLPDDIPYKMVGAGICDVNLQERKAAFSGCSRGYDMEINQDHLQKLRTKLPNWQII